MRIGLLYASIAPIALLSAGLAALDLGAPPPAHGAGVLVVVDTAVDASAVDGSCSLREAITATNINGVANECNASGSTGTDSIRFAIGSGTPVINISSPLPPIADAVLIRGNTGGATRVELRGSGAPARGLNIQGSNVTVRNLVINGFGHGIDVDGFDFIVAGSYIGTDGSGQVAMPNSRGIYLQKPGAQIGGTSGVISGGPCTGDCNLISGNSLEGIHLPSNHFQQGTTIKGNFIGTDADGIEAVPNQTGIYFSPTSIDLQAAAIGGSEPGAGNLISGNTAFGIRVQDSANLTIQGNLIGTNAAGNAAIPNGDPNNPTTGYGISLTLSQVLIGGDASGARNVIAGNTSHGILLGGYYQNPDLDSVTIQGNFIGTGVDGVSPLGNAGSGVRLGEDSTNNMVGGTSAGQANIIAFNGSAGVTVSDSGGPGGAFANSIRGNSIHSNAGKGIAISNANNNLSPPVINAASATSANGTTCGLGCTVDVYSDDGDEGRIFEGTAVVVNNLWSYLGPLTGPYITTVASDEAGDSSEFSNPYYIGTAPTPTLSPSPTGQSTPSPTPASTLTPTSTGVATPTGTATVTTTPPVTPTPTPTPTPTTTPPPTPTPTGSPDGLTQGDVDCDGDVTSVDALKELRDIVQLAYTQDEPCPDIGEEVASFWGDVDCSGEVTSVDALKILRHVAQLSVSQTEPCPDIGQPFPD